MKNINIPELAKKFKKASDIIRSESPDFIFAPVTGSTPFIDILHIIDRHFPLEIVEYLPNSSRFDNREELMKKWYHNFYEENEIGEKIKILSIDEVLSGSSAVKGFKEFKKSIEERAKEKAKGLSDEISAIEQYKSRLNKNIKYKIIGMAERGAKEYSFRKLMNNKLVHLINFDVIPTIDNISLNPIRLKISCKKTDGRLSYLPEIESFEITGEYLNLLREIGKYVGADPNKINPVNLSKIEGGLKKSRY